MLDFMLKLDLSFCISCSRRFSSLGADSSKQDTLLLTNRGLSSSTEAMEVESTVGISKSN